MNLAKILYEAYPHSDLLPFDPETDLNSLTTLYCKVTSENIGDGLFSFLAIELQESGGNLNEAIRMLQLARKDVDAVLQALSDQKHNHRLWQCPCCHKNAEVSYDDLAAVGTPICSDCDNDMVML